jgi:hypothetical protein
MAKLFCFRTDSGPPRLLNPSVHMEALSIVKISTSVLRTLSMAKLLYFQTETRSIVIPIYPYGGLSLLLKSLYSHGSSLWRHFSDSRQRTRSIFKPSVHMEGPLYC